MRVLQLCPKPPVPAVDGGCLAMDAITKGLLSQGVDLKIFTLATHKHPFLSEKMDEEYLRKTGIVHVDIDTEPSAGGFLGSFFTGTSYLLDRFISETVHKRLTHLLQEEEFDIIHLEGLFIAGYIDLIRKYSKAKIVLRTHNVERDIWRSLASNSKGFKKIIQNHLASRLWDEEKEIWKKVDGIAAISALDSQVIQKHVDIPVKVFPFGLEHPGEYKPPVEPGSVFHLGAMDWEPNREGIKWFLKEIWPAVTKRHPQAKFHLAGRKMPLHYFNKSYPNVFTDGEVDSADHYMELKGIMVVPLLSSSGIRIKILEGMALGKTIVTTRAGIKGIEAEHGKHLMIAENSKEFVEYLDQCLEDKAFSEQIGRTAREFVLSKYLNNVISSQLIAFYNSLLGS